MLFKSCAGLHIFQFRPKTILNFRFKSNSVGLYVFVNCFVTLYYSLVELILSGRFTVSTDCDAGYESNEYLGYMIMTQQHCENTRTGVA